MKKSLFQPVQQCQGPPVLRETTFNFLKRGGRKEAIKIRQWMEKWFQEFPEKHHKDLGKRLQSKKFAEFMSTYFELQIYSALRLLGCDVEVHPSFAGTDSKVDFGATQGEDEFYVEATVCGIGRGILRSNANEEDAVRKIRTEIQSPQYDVWLEAEGELLHTLEKKFLSDPIKELLNSSSADAVFWLGEVHPWRNPHTSIQKGNWKMNIVLAQPIAPDGKGRVHGPGRGGPVDGTSPIDIALTKKVADWAKKKLDNATFVIALNVCHSEYEWGDELSVIYGKSDPIIGQDNFSPNLSRVAGVIVVGNATLGRERNAPVQIHVNPDWSVPECFRSIRQRTVFGELIGLV